MLRTTVWFYHDEVVTARYRRSPMARWRERGREGRWWWQRSPVTPASSSWVNRGWSVEMVSGATPSQCVQVTARGRHCLVRWQIYKTEDRILSGRVDYLLSPGYWNWAVLLMCDGEVIILLFVYSNRPVWSSQTGQDCPWPSGESEEVPGVSLQIWV